VNSKYSSPDPFFRKTVLDNGVRVVSETIPHVRSVTLGVWADVGSRDESPAQNGITHFLEHMVFKGTRRRNVRDIARSLESLGGYLNAFTTKEHTCFYARVMDVHLRQAMDVLADIVLHATFRKDELEKERQVVIEELKNAEDNPEDIIHDYFEKSLFPVHPIGFPIIGTEENLRRFGRDELRRHVHMHYGAERIVVAAAGNVDHDRLVQLTSAMFGRLAPQARRHPRRPGPSRNTKRTVVERVRPIQQVHICIGTIAIGLRHRERYPMLLMNALLGEGMSSRLYQTIRERHGLAYSVYSYLNMLSDTGAFAAYAGTDRKHVGSALELLEREFARLRTTPVSGAELSRTKSQLKGAMMLSLENMSSRMMRLGSGELHFGTITPIETVLKKIDAVTAGDVQHAARRLFADQELSAVVIRPS
jgi:predicted Zn-dependent peptidase